MVKERSTASDLAKGRPGALRLARGETALRAAALRPDSLLTFRKHVGGPPEAPSAAVSPRVERPGRDLPAFGRARFARPPPPHTHDGWRASALHGDWMRGLHDLTVRWITTEAGRVDFTNSEGHFTNSRLISPTAERISRTEEGRIDFTSSGAATCALRSVLTEDDRRNSSLRTAGRNVVVDARGGSRGGRLPEARRGGRQIRGESRAGGRSPEGLPPLAQPRSARPPVGTACACEGLRSRAPRRRARRRAESLP
jgi:hypothetical protein